MGVIYDEILGKLREGEDGGGGGGSTPKIITVADSITNITAEQLESLNAGDIAIVEDVTGKYPCLVTFSKSNQVYFYYIYGDNRRLDRVKFTKSGGSWSSQFTRIPLVIDKENVQQQSGMLPNTLYVFGELDEDTTFTMFSGVDNTIANIWYWTFETGATAPTITWPAAITAWNGGSAPTINASKHYEICVMNGIATFMEV